MLRLRKLARNWLANKIIELALGKIETFEWSLEDQKSLSSFLSYGAGAKLLAHLNNNLNAIVNDAMSSDDVYGMKIAKGFALAISAIKLSLDRPTFNSDDGEKAESPSRSKTVSQPTIF